ncbi:MAG: ribonuclease D [Alphaproteobacteria bacterium]
MDIISSPQKARQLCNKLAENHAQNPFITIDTEFIRDRSYWAKLCLIQIACPEYAFALDPISNPQVLDPFQELLQNKNITKVLHGCKQDLEIFFQLYKNIPNPLRDTQVIAMALGYGDQPSYGLLAKQILGINICKNERFTNWAQRPLSNAQISYAESDVRPLCELYPQLSQKLSQLKRQNWIQDEMDTLCNPHNFCCDPKSAWQKLSLRQYDHKYLAILIALAEWREQQAQNRDLPRQFVCCDETIQAIARAPNLSVGDVLKTRTKNSRKPGEKDIENMIQIAKNASSNKQPLPNIPKPKTKNRASPDLLSLLKALLKARANHHKVAPRMIATSDELTTFALGKNTRVLSGWRYDIFGQDALALRNGKLGIVWENGEMKAIPVTPPAANLTNNLAPNLTPNLATAK